jgi:phosphoribosylformylglycinamidine cyclo-ligase
MDYRSSGVDIDAGNQAVELIKSSVAKTFLPGVLNKLGGFAAGFKLPISEYKNPILVSCTDGVGTKLKIAIELGKLDTLGIDLVAMCVNDLICMGAKPLFFLDYIACNKLIPNQMKVIVDGMVDGCLQAGCSLIGGEMAEMNDLYREGDFDLAGFCVGIVDEHRMIDGKKIESDQYIYGFQSSGLHSNGFSLVRKIMTSKICEEAGFDRDLLLTPTSIYVKGILELIEKEECITGIAHITGGGIAENLKRILPHHIDAELRRNAWSIGDVFKMIQDIGGIEESEMFKVFNMGIGMIIISSKKLKTKKGFFELGVTKSGNQNVLFT